ncbi:MAG TPA: serine/threonine-protein kinase [Chroococcidiopsis sp.]
MSGRILGDRYQLQVQLGRGVGKATWLAWDLFTQERVVIKLSFSRHDGPSADLKLLQRESAILQSMQHSAIPTYIDSFALNLSDGQGFALVYRYIVGQSLQDQLNAGHVFSEAEARKIATSALQVLADLHDCEPPIIHRNLKPSNILLTGTSDDPLESVALINFESAQNFAMPPEGSYTVIGTYGYTAPEQAAGRATRASDLYSLGVTLVHLLTGTDPARLPHRSFHIDFEQDVYLSSGFSQWLGQLVTPVLARRFSRAQQALRSLQEHDPNDTPAMLPPAQPNGSQVLLTKEPTSLEVLIPHGLTQLQLSIDESKLILGERLFGWQCRQRLVAQRRELKKLEVSGEQLALCAANWSYDLNAKQFMSESEIDWLANELSNWLMVPVKWVS